MMKKIRLRLGALLLLCSLLCGSVCFAEEGEAYTVGDFCRKIAVLAGQSDPLDLHGITPAFLENTAVITRGQAANLLHNAFPIGFGGDGEWRLPSDLSGEQTNFFWYGASFAYAFDLIRTEPSDLFRPEEPLLREALNEDAVRQAADLAAEKPYLIFSEDEPDAITALQLSLDYPSLRKTEGEATETVMQAFRDAISVPEHITLSNFSYQNKGNLFSVTLTLDSEKGHPFRAKELSAGFLEWPFECTQSVYSNYRILLYLTFDWEDFRAALREPLFTLAYQMPVTGDFVHVTVKEPEDFDSPRTGSWKELVYIDALGDLLARDTLLGAAKSGTRLGYLQALPAKEIWVENAALSPAETEAITQADLGGDSCAPWDYQDALRTLLDSPTDFTGSECPPAFDDILPATPGGDAIRSYFDGLSLKDGELIKAYRLALSIPDSPVQIEAVRQPRKVTITIDPFLYQKIREKNLFVIVDRENRTGLSDESWERQLKQLPATLTEKTNLGITYGEISFYTDLFGTIALCCGSDEVQPLPQLVLTAGWLADAQGNRLQGLSQSSFFACVTLKNISESGGTLLVAAYDAEGKFLTAHAASVQGLFPGQCVTLRFAFDPGAGEIARIRAFPLGADGTTPAGAAVTLFSA